jgi:archaellum component FlaC
MRMDNVSEKDLFVQALKEAFTPLFSSVEARMVDMENALKDIKFSIVNMENRIDSMETRIDYMETDVKDIKYKVVNIAVDLLNSSFDTRKTKLIIENEIKPVIKSLKDGNMIKSEKIES